MKNDPQALVDLIAFADKVRLHTRPGSQERFYQEAGIKATIAALKARMTREELFQACDIMARG